MKEISQRRQMVGYASGDILGGGAFALIGMFLLGFLTLVQQIPPAYVAVIILVGRLCDGFVDPLIGMLTDSTRSKWGRKRPWFIVAVIPIALFFSLMWNNLGITDTIGKSIYFTLMYVFMNASCSLAMVPYSGLLASITNDYRQRTNYMAIRNVFSVASVAISTLVPMLIWGMPNGPEKANSYALMGVIFGIFFSLPWIFTAFNTREVITEADPPKFTLKETISQYKSTFQNKSFRQYLWIFLLGQGATDIVTAALVFFLTWVIGQPSLGTPIVAVLMVGEFIALPINVKVAKKYGKSKVSLINLPIRILMLCLTFLFNASTPIWVILPLVLVMGFGQSAASFVPWNILPDVIDVDELITGHRRDGVYAACATFFRQTSSGVALFLLGSFLALFGFDEKLIFPNGQQSETAILGIKLTFALLPIIFSFIVMLIANKYRVGPREHKDIIELIANKRNQLNKDITSYDIKLIEEVTGCKYDKIWIGQK